MFCFSHSSEFLSFMLHLEEKEFIWWVYNNILICLQTHVFHHFQERKYILYYIVYYILCQTKLASTKLGFLIDRSCVKERWWWKLNKYYSIHRVFSVKKSKEIKDQLIFVIRNIVNIKINVQKTALQILDKPYFSFR